jgi:hypothetical protein
MGNKRSKMSLIKKDAVVVIVSFFTALHPDDKKFIKDKLLVGKDHLLYVDTDDLVYIDRLCSDLATLTNVVINNPSGSFEGQYCLGKLGYFTGLEVMNGVAIYSTRKTNVWIPKYELSNTNDLVACDLIRVI